MWPEIRLRSLLCDTRGVLLQAGVDANARSETGRTALHEACQGGHARAVQMLLPYTGHLDVQDQDGRSPALLAASNGELECLQLLVISGKHFSPRGHL